MDRYVPITVGEHKGTLKDWHPFVVHFDTSGLESLKNKDVEMHALMVNELLPSVAKNLQNIFKVRENHRVKLNIESGQCSEYTYPAHYAEEWTQAHLIVFFVAEDMAANVLGSASSCMQHGVTLRPTAGTVSMNMKKLNKDRKFYEATYSTLIHEVFHVMGFTDHDFQFFIDPTTDKRLTVGDFYQKKAKGNFRFLLKSKKILQYARQYFNCPNLPGVPLEDEGGEGSIASHFDKYMFGNEMMTASDVQNPVTSLFTLLFFEDSGWYVTDKTQAEPFTWA